MKYNFQFKKQAAFLATLLNLDKRVSKIASDERLFLNFLHSTLTKPWSLPLHLSRRGYFSSKLNTSVHVQSDYLFADTLKDVKIIYILKEKSKIKKVTRSFDDSMSSLSNAKKISMMGWRSYLPSPPSACTCGGTQTFRYWQAFLGKTQLKTDES